MRALEDQAKKMPIDFQVSRRRSSQTALIKLTPFQESFLAIATSLREPQVFCYEIFIGRAIFKEPVSENDSRDAVGDRHSQKSGFRRCASQEFMHACIHGGRRFKRRLNRSES